MYFEAQQSRLLELVRERIRRGELTERGIARTTGVSQPHVHNVLKGIRGLSPEFADILLHHLGLTIPDLHPGQDGTFLPDRNRQAFYPVPVLRGSTGGKGSPFAPERHESVYPFPNPQIARFHHAVALTLHHDPAMWPRFAEGDVALLDRADEVRRNPDTRNAYVVETGCGTAVRYIRHGGRSLYLVTVESLRRPEKWDYLSLAGRNILEIVRGRIVWIGRGMEAGPAEPD